MSSTSLKAWGTEETSSNPFYPIHIAQNMTKFKANNSEMLEGTVDVWEQGTSTGRDGFETARLGSFQ
jgi:hypothetical protein